MPTTELEHHLLKNLNPQQQEAVVHTNGPLLILAGAGSGKTTVITRRIAWLIEKEGVNPESILAMTFTNKAAEEMSERVKQLVVIPNEHLWISTFHKFCTRTMRQEGEHTSIGRDFVIFDTSDQKSLIKRVLTKLGLTEKQFHPKKVIEVISDFKNRCLLPHEARNEAHSDTWTKQVLDIYENYQQELKNNRACDFDDLLLHTERLFRNETIQNTYAKRFRYILVDEYQDTNKAQYLLVRHLAGNHHNLCVVGDEDQSIYGWRGADINNIFNFKKDFPEAVQIKLEQNYRSTQKILNAASKIIANNQQRIGKVLWTDLGDGNKIIFETLNNGHIEAAFIADMVQEEQRKQPDAHIAILYRANWQSRQMEEALRSKNIAYRLVGGTKFYERQEVKDIVSYLRLMSNPFDLISFRRSVNAPSRGVGPVTMSRIESAIPSKGTSLDGIEILMQKKELKGKSQRELGKYLNFFIKAKDKMQILTLSALVRWVIDESGYKVMLEDEATIESESRLRNLEEFISAAAEVEYMGLCLAEFLDRISLTSDTDKLERADTLSLMTIHYAKGLEFPTVFVMGMEEDVFPSRKALETDDGIEEERRLFYVAITRAQYKLYLTAAKQRFMMGKESPCLPSRFLKELPIEDIEISSVKWINRSYLTAKSNRFVLNKCFSAYKNDNDQTTSIPDHMYSFPSQGEVVIKPSIFTESDLSEKHDQDRPWPRGTKVISDHFGHGIILASTGSGEYLTYTVRFHGGEKRIMAKFGMLKHAQP